MSNDLYQRRSILAASISLVSCGGMTVNAHPIDEGKELLLAIKRVIDEDLIDKPERASEILGLAIEDGRSPNEDVRPLPVIGGNRTRKVFTEIRASIVSSDQPQRVAFGLVEFRVYNFDGKLGRQSSLLTDKDAISVFGDKFTLASSRIRPHWRPGTDFSDWSGKYPNETFIYQLRKPREIEMLISFGSKTQLSGITLRISKIGN